MGSPYFYLETIKKLKGKRDYPIFIYTCVKNVDFTSIINLIPDLKLLFI